jgi:hypothetical protein
LFSTLTGYPSALESLPNSSRCNIDSSTWWDWADAFVAKLKSAQAAIAMIRRSIHIPFLCNSKNRVPINSKGKEVVRESNIGNRLGQNQTINWEVESLLK